MKSNHFTCPQSLQEAEWQQLQQRQQQQQQQQDWLIIWSRPLTNACT